MSRRPALDGLRALAALGVVVHHCWQYAGHPWAPLGIWWIELSLGVSLFFCLSGFLVWGPWARAAVDPEAAPPRPARFSTLRAARILPLYYVTLGAAVALLYGTGHWRLVDDWRLIGFAVFAQNYVPSLAGKLNPPTWTLTIEVTFYVLVPLIGLVALRVARGRGGQLAVLGALTAACVAWVRLTPLPPVVRTTLPDVIGVFCAGMAARVLVEGRRVSRGVRRVLLVAGALLVWAHASGRLGAPLDGALRDLPAAVGFAAICVACSVPSVAPRVLSSRPLVYLGTLSYGIYLWHYPILLGLQARGWLPEDDVVAAIALVGGLSIAAAAMTWHGVERPILRWVRARRERVPSGLADGSRRPRAARPCRLRVDRCRFKTRHLSLALARGARQAAYRATSTPEETRGP